MDVIINNPPAAQTYQTQGLPYGYGPLPQGYKHHDGPPIGLIALLIGGFILLKRRRMVRRWMAGGDGHSNHNYSEHSHSEHNGPDFGHMREKFRRSREGFFNDGALSLVRERYAKGEINAEEYETLRRTLSGERKGEGYRPAPDEQ